MFKLFDNKTVLKQLNNESTSKENQIDNSSHLISSQTNKNSQELNSSQKTTQSSSQNESFLNFVQWANSQQSSTQSSQQNTNKPKKPSSQEIFGEDYELYKNASQETQISSQSSNLFASQNKFNPMLLNLNTTNDSDLKLTPNSIISIPSSQKTNYFEARDDKLKFPLTPEQSQDDGPELFTDDDNYDEQSDNDETIIDLNQKPNYSNDNDFNKQLGKSQTMNTSQHPYIKNISCIMNAPVNLKPKYKSKGKLNSVIGKLKSIPTIDNQFSGVDNDFNVNIGKSENYYEDNMQIDEIEENNCVERNKLSSFNQSLNSIGKGKHFSFGKYFDNSNQMECEQLAGLNEYQDREQQLNNDKVNVYRNKSSTSEYYDTISNLSRSSTPASYVTPIEDVYNEESSNDSLVRKRKKVIESSGDIVPRSKSKITKTSNQRNDEMKSLSQQMEGSCSLETPNKSVKKQSPLKYKSKNLIAKNPTTNKTLSSSNSIQTSSPIIDDTQFQYYDNIGNYFKGNDLSTPAPFTNDSSSNSSQFTSKSQSYNSFTRITRSNLKESTSKYSDLSESLDNFEKIDIPKIVQSKIGPIPKSNSKKTRSTKKSKENSFIAQRTPKQLKLNISEISPSNTQSRNSLSNKIEPTSQSRKSLSNKIEQAQNKTPRQDRIKSVSISSTRSIDSLFADLNDSDNGDSKKKGLRKEKNKAAARKYREKQKEGEFKLDENLATLESRYNELRSELKKLIIQKQSLISMVIDIGNETLPDYINKDDFLI